MMEYLRGIFVDFSIWFDQFKFKNISIVIKLKFTKRWFIILQKNKPRKSLKEKQTFTTLKLLLQLKINNSCKNDVVIGPNSCNVIYLKTSWLFLTDIRRLIPYKGVSCLVLCEELHISFFRLLWSVCEITGQTAT